MCKSQIINHIMEAVVNETEVPEELIRSSRKRPDIVDARSIAIKIMIENGLYPEQIAGYMNTSSATIRNLLTHYDERCTHNKIIAIFSYNIRKSLES